MSKELIEKKSVVPTPWRPFMDRDRWEKDAQRMIDQFFGRSVMPLWPEGWFRSEPMAAVVTPIVDVYVDNEDIVIEAELPGMEKDDIEVNLSNHSLTLKGEKKRKRKSRKKTTIALSAPTGVFPGRWNCLGIFRARK
jgi:HSP20 family protein